MGAEPKSEVNSIGLKLVRIKAGTFTMGQDGPASDYRMSRNNGKFDDADWDEKPAHHVTIDTPFLMGVTEVTMGQYRQYDAEHMGGKGADDAAVCDVSWYDAVKFCEWLSQREGRTYRLPTEAEWEYACRAGTTTLFHTGDALPAGFQPWPMDAGIKALYFPKGPIPPEIRGEVTGKGVSRKVGQTVSNAWGLYDMHGNVAEWCADWYGPYEANAQTNPAGRADGDFRVCRGGNHSTHVRLLRSANRAGWIPETKGSRIGFRVVVGEAPKSTPLPRPEPPLNAKEVSQSLAKVQAPSADQPVFSGPKPYVKIPAKSFGPLFSTHNHSPALAECPNRDLLAVWYSCAEEPGSELCNVASRLRLGVDEWEEASPFWDGQDVNDHGPKLWWDGDRTLYHFARGNYENIVRRSTDNGATWTKAETFQPVSEIGNAAIRTKEGYIVMTEDSPSSSLTISRDQGKTWQSTRIVDREAHRFGSKKRHAGIHAGIVQLADGRLMTMGRIDDAEKQKDYGIKTPMSFSADWGETWAHEASEFPAISSVQRAVLLRLREGPLLFCSFTDQWRDWKTRKGMTFKAENGGEFTGYGLFAAVSYDDGKTWPDKRLVTPGGAERKIPGIDRTEFTVSNIHAEPMGYLAAVQTREGVIQLLTSKNHYTFNLAWVKQLPTLVGKSENKG